MQLTRPILLIFFLFTFAVGYAQERYEIERVEIVHGNPRMMEQIDLYPYQSRLGTQEGAYFSQAEFDKDLKLLVADFDRVEPNIDFVDGKLVITIEVWTKPFIRQIRFEGNQKIGTSRLLSELDITPGTVFDRFAFHEAFHKVRTLYLQKGYFEAEMDYHVESDEFENQVDITVSIDEGKSGYVRDILFTNFTNAERVAVLDLMFTSKYFSLISWLTSHGVYNEEMLQQDRYIIINYLQNRGYADVNVEIDITEDPKTGQLLVHITAFKGQIYRFGEVTFGGNCIFSNQEIADQICINSGDVYSPDHLIEASDRISRLYGKCGYINTFVTFEPRLIADQCSYNVHFSVEEGEQYRVGMIKVFGNSCTQTKVILHETLLVPGQVFNIDKMRATEIRLLNTGFFKCVNVYPVESQGVLEGCGNYRDVHIEVEETGTGHFGISAGFSTSENLFAAINITEKNFNIAGVPAAFRGDYSNLRGGGEYFSILTQQGLEASSYGISWTKPHFMDTPWTLGFDIDYSTSDYTSNAYDIDAWGFSFHSHYCLDKFWKLGLHYRLRDSHIHLQTDNPSKELERQVKNSGLITAMGASFVHNTTNSIACPTSGVKMNWSVEAAGAPGDHNFLSAAFLNTVYFNVYDFAILKVRADYRFLHPLNGTTVDDIPIDERFFLGGAYEVRGYKPYYLGPKYENSAGKDDIPAGGVSMELFSIELYKPITSIFEPFVFFDAGGLSDQVWDYGVNKKAAYGIGARLSLMPGNPPVTIGYGWVINEIEEDNDVKHFFLTLGGRF
ncbi:MAG: outer membrane protein assembly factor BamA [Waddliaceae bacterium]